MQALGEERYLPLDLSHLKVIHFRRNNNNNTKKFYRNVKFFVKASVKVEKLCVIVWEMQILKFASYIRPRFDYLCNFMYAEWLVMFVPDIFW